MFAKLRFATVKTFGFYMPRKFIEFWTAVENFIFNAIKIYDFDASQQSCEHP
ncbi:hypothetical protein [Methanobacterium sp.]|uniref:hypothetical protein n=1 Tax=Methanobacterium sp. TaxID=2164 RepID=UPI003C7954CC